MTDKPLPSDVVAAPRLPRPGVARLLSAWTLALLIPAARWRTRKRKDARFGRVVLLFEPFGMGDIISLQPLVRILREKGYEVRFAARPEWQPILAPWVHTWIACDAPWARYTRADKYAWSAYRRPAHREFIRRLRDEADGVIGLEPRGDVRSLLLLHWAGCAEVASPPRYLGTRLAVPPWASRRVPLRTRARRWEQNLQLLVALGETPPASCEAPRLEHLRPAREPGGSARIGFVPLSPWAPKQWRPERWVALRERLVQAGFEVVGLCGPGQTAAAEAALGGAVRVTPCPSVPAWAEKMTDCRAVVSVNTGPMHLADALGIPLVVLEGSSVLPLWAPSGPASRVVHHQPRFPCAPCWQVGRRTRCETRCMEAIGVDEVHAALMDVLAFRSEAVDLRDAMP